MSVALNFNTQESNDAKKLIFLETTGTYDALNLTGGWGGSNEATTDAVTTTISITPPGETVAVAITVAQLAGLGSFPTTNTQLELEITSDVLGLGTDVQLPDGLYDITYTVVTASFTYTLNHKIFLSGKTRCCVFDMLADVDPVDCNCESAEKTLALEAFTYYRSLIANAAAGNQSKFDEILELTNALCSSNRC